MKLKTTFTVFDEQYTMTLDTENIDRNYDDENYGYWIVERGGRFFEVNIWKNDDGNFTRRGKVYAFADRGAFEQACDADEETDITLEEVRTLSGLMVDCDHLKQEMVQQLLQYVLENGTAVTDYERNEFGLDCDEDEHHRVTQVLNFFDNKGCHFCQPDMVNDDSLAGMTEEDYYDRLYCHMVHTAYQCLYVVTDDNDNLRLCYYRFTNGGVTFDDDQAEPDHGYVEMLPLLDFHYLLEAINTTF